ncbi:MAG TPA: PhzF family phenazine biosynthesis protein [Verrucomicrobia bacterium]|nr:PhzF family phenazine biosynthesis protein [Verrucomicrobiota bacterium]
MNVPIFQIDAFAVGPFTGNPAAVCLLEKEADADWMQSVAAEMNLSETAFVAPRTDGFELRWFTPVAEVDLCGHATLASAHLLWETGRLAEADTARFHTRSGLLTAVRVDDWIELDFPATPAESIEPPPGLSDLLGSVPKFVGRSRFDLLLELTDAEELRDLNPDFVGLSSLPVRGLIVTAKSDVPEYAFLSRFFAPAAGINEDPVTGSAHCALAPFWAERLGKTEMTAYQCSPRGGVVKVKLAGDRVLLRGKAVTVLRGELV